MKRSGIKRKTPLRPSAPGKGTIVERDCLICGRHYLYTVIATGFVAKTCSRQCLSVWQSRQATERAALRPPSPGRPLETKHCEHCGVEFTYRPTGGMPIKCCSKKCANAMKRQSMQKRNGERNPNYRHGRRMDAHSRTHADRWYSALAERCSIPGCTSTSRLALHHIVYRQHLRIVGGDIWDPRNGMTLCNSDHMSHHRRGRVIPLALLPDSVFEFAGEIMGPAAYDYLRLRYGGDDPRVDALLAIPPR